MLDLKQPYKFTRLGRRAIAKAFDASGSNTGAVEIEAHGEPLAPNR